MREAMLAQLVDAFMVGDWPRFQQAQAWLRDYADSRPRDGKVRRGKRWFNSEIDFHQQWLRNLSRAASSTSF